MCGIAGIFSLSGKPVDNGCGRVERMARMLDHRVPDQWGLMMYVPAKTHANIAALTGQQQAAAP